MLNREKVTVCFEAKAVPRKKSSIFEEITHSKDSLSMRTLNTMKRKSKSLLSTEISLTTSSDEGVNVDFFDYSKTNLVKAPHPTIE
jgi:hypothetical protein